MKSRDYQLTAEKLTFEAWNEHRSVLVVMPTGCHSIIQPILMFDGSIKKALEIRVGDLLMGPDSNPRRVLKLHEGRSKMVEVKPVKGTPFIVTDDHTLSLIKTSEKANAKFECQKGGKVIDITIGAWRKMSKWKKHVYKLFRTGVTFPVIQEPLLSPYVMGLLIGDGSFRHNLSFTSADKEAVSAINQELFKFDLTLRTPRPAGKATTWEIRAIKRSTFARNIFRKKILKALNFTKSHNKFIPSEFKIGSREVRLGILAGLMDSDGHLTRGGYDYISKSEQLSNDVAFVCRSLGLAAYVSWSFKRCQTGKGGIYYRVSISGDCSIIPCRIPHKQCTQRRQKKSVLRTGFKIHDWGKEDYIGFTVDGDHRYLLGDFTVTHNCGKTVVAANIINKVVKETGKKALFVCERRELVWQAANKIKQVTGLQVDIEMGDYKASKGADLFGVRADVIVSTIQTQNAGGDGGGRLTKFDPQDFGILVSDEAHHNTAQSYQRCFNYYKANADLKILGVTATPDRADEEALGQVFDHVAFEYPLYAEAGKPSAIRDGWLVSIVQQFVSATVDFSHIKTVAGDLAGAELEAVLKAEKPLHEMTQAIFEIMHGLEPGRLKEFNPQDWACEVYGMVPKRAIAFTRFVNHARMLADILNRISPGFAAYVHGAQDTNERKKIIEDFQRGKGAKILCNVNILSEGYDDDGVKIIFSCCPTKSRSRYAQQIGRGTRPLTEVAHRLGELPSPRLRRFEISISDKPELLVVDFCGNSGKHKLITCADILGGHISDAAIESAIARARNGGRPVKMDELLEEEELRAEQKRQCEAEEAARKARIVGKSNYKLQNVDPFDLFQVKPVKERGWDAGKVPSPKMRGFLQKFGFDPNKFNFTQAGQLIGTIKDRLDRNLCTPKQALWLKNHGYAPDSQYDEARAIMDAWANNGWRKPAEIPSIVPPRPKKQAQQVKEEDSIPF